MNSKPPVFLITCEHAEEKIPAPFSHNTELSKKNLPEHTFFDPGARSIAKSLAKHLNTDCYSGSVSRQIVDCNRSLHHPSLFGKHLPHLSKGEKEEILNLYYYPMRTQTLNFIRNNLQQNRRVIHLSVHSFTPIWNGELRPIDLGFLYDPTRKTERELVDALIRALRNNEPDFRYRRNAPYLGKADGHCTALRKQFSNEVYLGLELEFNQSLIDSTGKPGHGIKAILKTMIHTLLK